jgi:hypothetical protein
VRLTTVTRPVRLTAKHLLHADAEPLLTADTMAHLNTSKQVVRRVAASRCSHVTGQERKSSMWSRDSSRNPSLGLTFAREEKTEDKKRQLRDGTYVSLAIELLCWPLWPFGVWSDVRQRYNGS